MVARAGQMSLFAKQPNWTIKEQVSYGRMFQDLQEVTGACGHPQPGVVAWEKRLQKPLAG